MAAGDVTIEYSAHEALTQTNLDGLASDTNHLAGWGSATIDNTSTKSVDHKIMINTRRESSGLSAGEVRAFLVEQLNDSAYPAIFSSGTAGTEGALTFGDTEQRDAVARFAGKAVTDTGASEDDVITIPSVAAVFDGNMPARYILVITQSTGTTLETTGDLNQVYLKRSAFKVAQS